MNREKTMETAAMERTIVRGFRLALVKAAERRLPRLAELEASIRADSVYGNGTPQKDQIRQACRLRAQLGALARMAAAMEDV